MSFRPDPKPAKRSKRRPDWRRDLSTRERALVAFVERFPCEVPTCSETATEFDHIPTRGSQGKGHARGWSLCRCHHDEKGEGLFTFEDRHGINSEAIIALRRKQFSTQIVRREVFVDKFGREGSASCGGCNGLGFKGAGCLAECGDCAATGWAAL